jgi:Family of unknown function (DUF6496)
MALRKFPAWRPLQPHMPLAHSYLQGVGCVSARKSNSKRKSSGRKYSKKAGEEVRTEMHHMRSGKHKVNNRKQAIAIGLSKARRKGAKVPRKAA